MIELIGTAGPNGGTGPAKYREFTGYLARRNFEFCSRAHGLHLTSSFDTSESIKFWKTQRASRCKYAESML